MKCILLWLALLKCVFATSYVSVQLPYSNPAGVTYVEGKASADLVAGPNQKTSTQNVTVVSRGSPARRGHSEHFQRYEMLKETTTTEPAPQDGTPPSTLSRATLARNLGALSSKYVHAGSSGTIQEQPFSYQFFSTSSSPTVHHSRIQPGPTHSYVLSSSNSPPQQDKSPNYVPPSVSSTPPAVGNNSTPGTRVHTIYGQEVSGIPSVHARTHPSFGGTIPTYSTAATPTLQPVSAVHPQYIPVARDGFVTVQSPAVSLINPTVYSAGGAHVLPTISNVPIARVQTQQGVVSKTIDVAQPAIKTSKYEVRRPAIKKQFYDIEERIIVRPAGTVVLELDHPISQTPKGETIQDVAGQFSNAGSTVSQGDNLHLEIGTPSEHGIISQGNQEQQSVGSTQEPASVDEPDSIPGVEGSTQAPSIVTTVKPESFVTTTAPAAQDDDTVVIEARTSGDYDQNQSVQSNTSYVSPPNIPQSRTGLRNFIVYQRQPVQCTAACQRQAGVNTNQDTSNLPPFVQQQNTYYYQQQARNLPPSTIYYQQNVPSRPAVQGPPPEGTNQIYHSQPQPAYYYQHSARTHPQQAQQDGSVFQSQPVGYYQNERSQPQEQQYQQQVVEEQAQVTQVDKEGNLSRNAVPFMITVGEPDFRYPPYVETSEGFEANTTNKSARLTAYDQTESHGQIQQGAVSAQQVEQSDPPEVRTTQDFTQYETSPNLSPQESNENQRKYISLLLARGGVSEVSANLEQARTGYLRSRVISATPAPFGAPPAGEQVHTRRVVISQPLETVREVEVQEPVTKFQRLSIKQPVQYRTARVDHAPIYTRRVAPVLPSVPIAVNYQRIH